jgi:hypothetical protein
MQGCNGGRPFLLTGSYIEIVEKMVDNETWDALLSILLE